MMHRGLEEEEDPRPHPSSSSGFFFNTNNTSAGATFNSGGMGMNSGLAAAIAAAEYRKQREAAAAAHIFVAAHDNGHHGPPLPPHHPRATLMFGSREVMIPPQQGPQAHQGMGKQGHFGGGEVQFSSSKYSARCLECFPEYNYIFQLFITQNPTANVNINISTITTSTGNNTTPVIPPRIPIFSNGRPKLPPPRWYDASMPLGMNEDKYYLSKLQCVLMSEFRGAFGTTQMSLPLRRVREGCFFMCT